MMLRNACSSFFHSGGGISNSTLSLPWSGFTSCLEIISLKKWNASTPEMALIFKKLYIFFSAYLQCFVLCCIVVWVILIIPYNYNIISNTEFIWQLSEYFIQFFPGICPLMELLQTGVFCICTYQIDKRRLLGMMISHQALWCGNLNFIHKC